MTATARTTIRGVTVLTPKRRHRRDTFDLELSTAGIEIRRPGSAPQHLSWDRVSRWEVEERADYIVLTLRGDGSVTPLVVRGWAFEDLAGVMQTLTAELSRTTPGTAAPEPAPAAGEPVPAAGEPVPAAGEPVPAHAPERAPEGPSPRSSRTPSRARHRSRRAATVGWRPVVTVVLLVVLATAVTLVLLQSAGVINWGFLGPTS